MVGLAAPAGEPAQAAAGINKTLNFQGRLLNAAGAVVADGNYNMKFKVYQDGDGASAGDTTGSPAGTLMWTEIWQNNIGTGSTAPVVVKNGYFSVNLGSFCAFAGGSCQGNSNTAVDFNQDTLWLSMDVTVNGTNTSSTPAYDPEMLPMRRMASAVYALNAGQLGGLTSGQFVQLTQPVQNADLTSHAAIGINATGGSNNLITLQSGGTDVFDISSTGNLVFGNNADKTISVTTSAAATAGRALTVSAGTGGSGSGSNGGVLTVQGGNAGGTNANGGNIVLTPGVKTGIGTPGSVVVKPAASNDTASIFQVQDASGDVLLGVNSASTSLSVNASTTITGVSVAGQTPVVIQQTPAGGSGTLIATLSSNATVGNTLVVETDINNPSGSVASLSGGGVTNWFKAAGASAVGGLEQEIWYGTVTTAGSNSITMTILGGAVADAMSVTEVSGLAALPLDQAAGTLVTPSTTLAATPSVTTTVANEIIFGFAQANSGGMPQPATPSNSFTSLSMSSYNNEEGAYRIVSSTGTYSTSWTNGGSDTYETSIASFKAAGSQPDILDLASNGGSTVASVSATGSTIFQNSANSTAAFQIQNATGTSLFNVDTTNSAIYAGYRPTQLGDTVVQSTENDGGQNAMEATRITTGPAGTLSSISVYISAADSSPNNHLQVAIYDDNATSCTGSGGGASAIPSCPGNKITSSGSQAITGNAWNTIALSTALSAATNYWLVVNNDSSSNSLNRTRYETGRTGVDSYAVNGQTFGTWPASFCTSNDCSANPPTYTKASLLSLYATMATSTDNAVITDSSGHVAIGGSAPDAAYQLAVTAGGNGTGGALTVQGTQYNVGYSQKAFTVSSDLVGTTYFGFDSINGRADINIDPTYVQANAALNVLQNSGTANILNLINNGSRTELTVTSGGDVSLSGDNDHAIQVETPSSAGNGANLTLASGNANGSGNNGGNLVLQGGASGGGGGTGGSVIVKPQTDSTAAFQVQNASATSLLTVDTINSVVTTNAGLQVHGVSVPGSTPAYIQEANNAGTGGSSTATFAANTAVGNTLVLMAQVSSGTLGVGSVSGGGVSSWTKVSSASVSNGVDYEMETWYGTVTSAGSNSVTVTESGSGTDNVRTIVNEVSGVISSPVDQAAANLQSSCGAGPCSESTQSITTTAADEIVFAFSHSDGGDVVHTPTNGFTGLTAPTTYNAAAYKIASSTGSYNTSWTFDNGLASEMAIVSFKSYASLGTTPNIAEFSDSSSNLVGTIGATGAVSLQNSSDSAAAFQIQNAAGTALLTADTTNQRISVGTGGTATGQLYVAGSMPASNLGSVSLGSAQDTGLAVQGKYAYAVSNTSGKLYIYDITNPASPTLRNTGGTSVNGYSPNQIVVQGKFAYISTNGSNAVVVMDISNPAAPSVVGSVLTSGTPKGIYVQGRYAYYVSNNGNQLQIIDIANPASPVIVGSVSVTSPVGIYVQGKYAYTTENNGGTNVLDVIDVSNPASPTKVGLSGNIGAVADAANGIYVVGRYAYVATAGDKLYVVDVSSATSPSVVTNISVDTTPGAIYAQGRYLYIVASAAGPGTLKCIRYFHARQSHPGRQRCHGNCSDRSEGYRPLRLRAQLHQRHAADFRHGRYLQPAVGGGRYRDWYAASRYQCYRRRRPKRAGRDRRKQHQRRRGGCEQPDGGRGGKQSCCEPGLHHQRPGRRQ